MKIFRALKTFEPQASKMEFHSKDTKKVIWEGTDYEVTTETDNGITVKYYIQKNQWIDLHISIEEIKKYEINNDELTTDKVKDILSKISFLPSCVDFAWGWEVVKVNDEKNNIKGFLINTTFRRPDINTGAIGIGKGRRMWIEANATETSIIMTAWVCINLITTHELLESFLVDGAKILNPHKTLEELAYPEHLKHELENNEHGHH